jgi:hypothetical protein
MEHRHGGSNNEDYSPDLMDVDDDDDDDDNVKPAPRPSEDIALAHGGGKGAGVDSQDEENTDTGAGGADGDDGHLNSHGTLNSRAASDGRASSNGTKLANQTAMNTLLGPWIGSYPTNTYQYPSSNMSNGDSDSAKAHYAEHALTRNGKDKAVPCVSADDHRLHAGIMKGLHPFLGILDLKNKGGLPYSFWHLYDAVLSVHHVPDTHVRAFTYTLLILPALTTMQHPTGGFTDLEPITKFAIWSKNLCCKFCDKSARLNFIQAGFGDWLLSRVFDMLS